jgi:hypothetical protein
MNIFFLDKNPKLAAQMQCDKHVVKMILETAQMLSTAHRILDGHETKIKTTNSQAIWNWLVPEARSQFTPKMRKWFAHPDQHMDDVLYAATHINHPSNIWVRENSENYNWLYCHFIWLCSEYTKRYNKTHMTDKKLTHMLIMHPKNITTGCVATKPPLAMPDEFKSDDVVKSYKDYYISKQKSFKMTWTNSKTPEWFKVA